MIVPARWYSGGKGLDKFRSSFLHDERLCVIHDYPETELCFPGINIRGGVCYFLWSRDHTGPATIYNHSSSSEISIATRPLLENGVETFIRYNKAISILAKVRDKGEETYGDVVQSRNPFGITANFSSYKTVSNSPSDLLLYRSRRGQSTDKKVYVDPSFVQKNEDLIGRVKVLVSKASPGGDEYPHAIITTPFVAEPGSVCTETYLIIDTLSTVKEAANLVSYMKTRFFRFLMSLIKNTQNISKGCFAFVPVQNLAEEWTDEMLYGKYSISNAEIAFIESMIKPLAGDE